MSPAIRMYFPIDKDHLDQLADQHWSAPPLPAFGVTDAYRQDDPSGDAEAWEFRALQEAAVFARERGAPVLVVAADVADADLDHTGMAATHGEHAAVGRVSRLLAPLHLQQIAAFHLGNDLLGAGDVSQDPTDIELSWFDTTELAHVVRLTSSPQ